MAVTESAISPTLRSTTKDPFLIGVVAGILGAVGYTAANICLRTVAVESDPVFVSFVKAIPIALATGAAVVWQIRSGLRQLLTTRWIIRLLLLGVFTQLAGNVAFQWALGQIGLALTVPLSMGMLLIGSAVLARLWLAEPIPPRSAAAMLLLVCSITVLSLVANQSVAAVREVDLGQIRFWRLGCGLGAACLSGFSYGVGNVVIRRALSEGASLAATLLMVSLTGVVVLGAWSLWQVNPSSFDLHPNSLWAMILAGIFNAVGFYSLGKALQCLPVIHTNLLTASQVMLCALCGMLLFGEPAGALQIVGIALTLAGLMVMRRPRN